MASRKQKELERLVTWFTSIASNTKKLAAGKKDDYDPNLPDFSIVSSDTFQDIKRNLLTELEKLNITNHYIRSKLQVELDLLDSPKDLYCYALCSAVKYEQQRGK